jgi:hypothetical protein
VFLKIWVVLKLNPVLRSSLLHIQHALHNELQEHQPRRVEREREREREMGFKRERWVLRRRGEEG